MTPNDKADDSDAVRLSWENLPPPPPRIPRTADSVGKRCAADNCGETRRVTFNKPLCWSHWKEFDEYLILECERCHWFAELVGEWTDEELCYECVDRERRGYPPTPIYAHGPVERRIRYLYILKLDGGQYYAGQTNHLAIRLNEHKDGTTPSTKGNHPKLVYFKEWVGRTNELNRNEDMLNRMARENPRAIRRKVEEWQQPLRLVELGV